MDKAPLPPEDRPPLPSRRRPNRGLLWAAALATVVLAIATVIAFTSDSDDDVLKLDPNVTQPADPTLQGTDVTGQPLPAASYETFDGQAVRLSTADKPTVINFWAASCGPCVAEMPDLEKTYGANQERVAFLGLQVAERAESGLDMIARTGVTYPTGRDPSGEVLRSVGGLALPRTVLVRADGTIAAVHNGALSQAELQTLIDERLG